MDFDYQIYKLSNKFAKDHPQSSYPETLTKLDRPHYCLLIDTHSDYFICVPFRSNIMHNNAYLFKNTERSKRSRSGLDYSKIAIVKDTAYLDDQNVVIDRDEYKETVKNAVKITTEVVKYIDTYIAHINGTTTLHPKEYNRRYKYSTLPYYHDILGLNAHHTKNKNTVKKSSS